MRYRVLRVQIERHDINDPGEPNLFRTLPCARVLRQNGEGKGKIVVDTPTD
jgi:hypothetical protein